MRVSDLLRDDAAAGRPARREVPKPEEIIEKQIFTLADKLEKVYANLFGTEDALRALIRNGQFKQTVWNKLYRRETVGALRFPAGKYHEDEFFTWRAFLNAKQVAAVDLTGYFYFQRPDSIMGEAWSAKRLDALEAMAQRRDALKTALPAVYPDACAALAKNCIYQYQRFLRDGAGDPDGDCRRKVMEYYRENDLRAATAVLPRDQTIWYRAFAKSPETSAKLRNRLKIGF